MKNLSTGTGLALLATAIVAYPIVNRISSVDQTAHASVPVAAIAAVSTAATAQATPTIVWYQAFARNLSTGSSGTRSSDGFWIVRAWSDGKIEGRWVNTWDPWSSGINSTLGSCVQDGAVDPCLGPWVVISDPAQGLTYRSDINFDAKVNGADLATMLADWGDAPRYDIPPSDCPLNLINP